ncbi:hypothetical protein MTO96_009925 [Rhipicephalus appendiculatus]
MSGGAVGMPPPLLEASLVVEVVDKRRLYASKSWNKPRSVSRPERLPRIVWTPDAGGVPLGPPADKPLLPDTPAPCDNVRVGLFAKFPAPHVTPLVYKSLRSILEHLSAGASHQMEQMANEAGTYYLRIAADVR